VTALTGGCQCGRITFHLAARRYRVYACHCLECQKQSASAFALSMPVWSADMTVSGEPASYVRATDSGTRTHCFFCPTCGTRLFHRSERSPEIVTVKAGTLDGAPNLTPVAHLWVCRKLPWLVLPPETPRFDKQPGDLTTWRSELLPR
jgi:hypothetical protein